MASKEVLDKWINRSRKGPDISINTTRGGEMVGLNEDIVSRWQKEFQADFCNSCVHFDIQRQGFKEKGHQNNPDDCVKHWTDIVGICFNYSENGTGRNINQVVADYKGTAK